MSDPDNFLRRWSRRKREAVEARPESADDKQTNTAKEPGEISNRGIPASESAASPVGEFDAASLPPIESIGAGTDISAFMKPGVPSALRHAALRRAWSADPVIRDFMGPTENYWDAVGPEGVPGFGPLDPKLDVERMVSQLFGEAGPENAKEDSSMSPGPSAPSAAESGEQDESRNARNPEPASVEDHSLSHRAENGAMQNQSQSEQKTVRRHGGAMPE